MLLVIIVNALYIVLYAFSCHMGCLVSNFSYKKNLPHVSFLFLYILACHVLIAAAAGE